MTQGQLAKAIGVDQSKVSDMEREIGFTAEVLIRLSEALGVSPLYIMRGGDQSASDELVSIFHRMRPSQRAAILEVARSMGRDPYDSALDGVETGKMPD
jgi:transcriptional regulator with XRE-family HTH domain